jgi:hypothetical protein
VQEGLTAKQFLKVMGERVGRSTLFGIPLQQQWSFRVSGKEAPTYYLESDAPLYYYSFTDAVIAKEYLSLDAKERERFDPMITGFNPTDMYAADHIKRVLKLFPGVFEGIGEFTIHKEFVSSKIAGEVASLTDPALDRILDTAGEIGLVVLLHSDIQTPFPKESLQESVYYNQIIELFKRHPKTTIIWAHIGMGRVVRPMKDMAAHIRRILDDPKLKNVYFDISWDEVAKYFTASEDVTQRAAEAFNKYSDRFLFGTDNVATGDPKKYYEIFDKLYAPLWKLLTPEASERIRKGNYERLFNEARVKVRKWENAHE